MIQKLSENDIDQVAHIHKQELPGFLPELGIDFLKKFYKTSLLLPIMFTFVERENEQILGFVTGAESTKGLYIKIISKDYLGFGILFLRFFITNPKRILKVMRTLAYPGFSKNDPELLTIAVSGKYQGKGIGKRLFRETVRDFYKRGKHNFKISVYNRLPAVRFYKKIGCKHVATFDFLGEKMSYFRYKIQNPKSQ